MRRRLVVSCVAISFLALVSPVVKGWSFSPDRLRVSIFKGVGDVTPIRFALGADGATRYVVGEFSGTADFDPTDGSYELTSAGGKDIFLARFDANGDVVWVHGMGSTGDDAAYGIAVDGLGDIYIVGGFRGTVDFDPGSGTSSLVSPSPTGIDGFVLKMTSSGSFIWANNFGTTAVAYTIAVDQGSAYVVGAFGSTGDFDFTTNTFSITSNGQLDAFVVKFDAITRALSWARKVGGTGNDEAKGIDVGPSGDLFVVGNFSGTADLDPGSGDSTRVSNGARDVFVWSSDSTGAFNWSTTFGGALDDDARSVRVGANGQLHVGGVFKSQVDFDPGPLEMTVTSDGFWDSGYLLTLGAAGVFRWVRTVTTAGDDGIYGIDVDAFGNVYAAGYVDGQADLDPQPNVGEISGSGEALVWKMSSSGGFVWSRQIGGTAFNAGIPLLIDRGRSRVLVGGYFKGVADVDPTDVLLEVESLGGREGFLYEFDFEGLVAPTTTTTSTTTTSSVAPVSTLWSTTTTNPTNSVVSPITSYSINPVAPTTTTSTITPTSTIPIVQRRPSISINDGDEFTTSELVEVSVVAPSARSKSSGEIVKVELSNDGGFKESKSFSINEGEATLQWRLQSSRKGVITKVVYARFNDSYGGVVLTLSDDIILDNTKPVLRDLTAISTSSTPNAVRVSEIRSRQVNLGVRLVIRGSDSISGLGLIEIRSSARGAAVAVSFGRSGGSPSVRAMTMTKVVTVASGSKTLQVRLIDRAGNTSPWRTVTSK